MTGTTKMMLNNQGETFLGKVGMDPLSCVQRSVPPLGYGIPCKVKGDQYRKCGAEQRPVTF
jgi:hypothetical protein